MGEAALDIDNAMEVADAVNEGFDSWDEVEAFSGEESNESEESDGSIQAVSDSGLEEVSGEDPTEPNEEGGDLDSEADKAVNEEEIGVEVQDPKEAPVEEGDKGEESEEVIEYEEVKINGEIQKFDRKEVIAKGKEMLSGGIAYDKKFSELDKSRKEHETEVNQVNAYINDFANLMRNGDTLGALSYFAEFGGVAPHKFKQDLIQGLLPEIAKYEAMSPDQIDLEYNRQEADYYKKQSESLEQQNQYKQAESELITAENEIREAQEIDQEVWDDASAHVKAHLEDRNQYTPELVRDFIVAERAENLIGSVDEKLINNAVLYDSVQSIIKNNPDFTDDDILGLLRGAQDENVTKPAQEKVSKSVAKKVMKSNPIAKQKSAEFEPIKDSDGDEILDWDDLDMY